MSTDVRRPQRLSLTQQCADSMKQHMMRSALKSGDRLPTEQEWVEMLGVSRLVVREALQMLAGSGLIDVQQGALEQRTPPLVSHYATCDQQTHGDAG
jgi:DNA-binding FadR family transcriptional regulator